ncbi:MAG: 5-formyltetrahydrofolate cyclo-ligase [Syntrophomonadaceae bacterium]|nr:5-formyltetrahydrofolate cyclo-ligase [Syntrophomonadaceae bacterium]
MEKSGDLEIRAQTRLQMRQRRKQISPQSRREAGERVNQRLWQLWPVREAERLMAFAPLAEELDMEPFIAAWLASGRQLYLPRVGAGNELQAVSFTGWQHCAPGRFGVREPLGEAADPSELQVILVPGLAFDAQGYRLGYGRAYYDRFLSRLPQSVFKCGVGYEFQVIPHTWPQPHDIPLDWLLTEQSEVAVNMDFF